MGEPFDTYCPLMGGTKGRKNYWASKCALRKSSKNNCPEECVSTKQARDKRQTALTSYRERDDKDVYCEICGRKVESLRLYRGRLVGSCKRDDCRAERRKQQIKIAKKLMRRSGDKNGKAKKRDD